MKNEDLVKDANTTELVPTTIRFALGCNHIHHQVDLFCHYITIYCISSLKPDEIL